METLNESEIKSWLDVVLKEDTEHFSLKILGNSGKGDGYVGDIIYVSLESTSKEYHLVLKCSKRSQALRKNFPVKRAFVNEIYIYDTVLPLFVQFQAENGITDSFDSVPKCYGTLITEDMEIIVFENLNKIGYSLWDKKKPLTRQHINFVVTEYAKLHSISIGMQKQLPQKFEELASGFGGVFQHFIRTTNIKNIFESSIDEIYEVLKDDLDENVLNVWKALKEQIYFIFCDMVEGIEGLKVILHGDCWSNNFMFKNDDDNELLPLKVAFLDWQISTYSSPIIDLSYFIFAGISAEDLDDVDNILEYYYETLKSFSRRFGSNLDTMYPFKQFLDDWKKYCKVGIVMSALICKLSATEKDEVVDIGDAADDGGDLGTAFSYNVKNKSALKKRARHIVKYVVENKLI